MVDDEKPYLDFLTAMFGESLGWPVRAFTCPLAALEALPEIDAGVIVTDYWMPVLNGFEFIRAAERLRPGIPCIMMSGHPIELADNPPGPSTALRAILPKPFGWRQLADKIMLHAPAFASTLTLAPTPVNPG